VSRAATTWLVLLLLAAAGTGVRPSGADFTAASTAPATTATAAAQFDTLTVALADPGEPLGGAVTLTASAASDDGVAEVRLQRAAAGAGSWSDICAVTAAPYGCTWSTTALPDGAYDLRAVATDGTGRTRATTPLRRTVDNTAPTVALTDPGPLSGSVTLAATTSDGAGTGVQRVRYEVRGGAGAWLEACTATAAPFTCSWATGDTADGLVDLRAVATDGAGRQTTSAVLAGRRVDNTPPASATLADPGTLLQGTVAFSGAASDGGGIASWTVQVRASGGTAWTDACSDTTAPYACSWASTGVADGTYDVRALARDAAGGTTASAVRAGVRVDNAGPALSVPDPGATLRATLALSATASDPAGMQRVTFQGRAAGASAWTTLCDDTAAPWTCAYDTTAIPDGAYDLQVVATDALGHTTTVAYPGRVVDNTAPAAADIQAGNVAGGTAGRLEAGDWLRLTFSEPVRAQTIASGWDGSTALDVVVRVANAGGNDTLQVWDAADATRLGLTSAATPIRLAADFVSAESRFTARLVRSGGAYTVTLVAMTSGTLRTNAAAAAAMAWTPSSSVLDTAGNAAAPAAVTETGTNDRDF
jgi:Bacterial Ig domain